MLKKALLPAVLIALAVLKAKKDSKLPLIGDKAPSFKASTTQGEINFPSKYKGKWIIFFSHPADFTPVCTTEFVTFQNMRDDFKALNAELVGLSVDSLESHFAWLKNIKDKIDFNGLKNIDVKFPLIDDKDMKIAKKYGMLHPNASGTKTVRAVFIIDPKGIIRAILYYPLSNGRNMEEIKRLLIALQTTDKFDLATPADWIPGEDAIVPPPPSKEEAVKRLEHLANLKCSEWYLCFKNLPKETIEETLVKE